MNETLLIYTVGFTALSVFFAVGAFGLGILSEACHALDYGWGGIVLLVLRLLIYGIILIGMAFLLGTTIIHTIKGGIFYEYIQRIAGA